MGGWGASATQDSFLSGPLALCVHWIPSFSVCGAEPKVLFGISGGAICSPWAELEVWVEESQGSTIWRLNVL